MNDKELPPLSEAAKLDLARRMDIAQACASGLRVAMNRLAAAEQQQAHFKDRYTLRNQTGMLAIAAGLLASCYIFNAGLYPVAIVIVYAVFCIATILYGDMQRTLAQNAHDACVARIADLEVL
jgi:hypothetical protein